MSSTVLKTRIQHKNDTTENWAKANNFIPLAGELIVYNTTPPQVKIGDGATLVGDLPFIKAGSDTTVTPSLTSGTKIGSISIDGTSTDLYAPNYSLSSFGITATAAELNYVDGVTSSIQTQLNNKSNTSHTHTSLRNNTTTSGTTLITFDDQATLLGMVVSGDYSADDDTSVYLSLRVNKDTGAIVARTDSKAGTLYPALYTSKTPPPLSACTGTLALTQGGTGATTAAAALVNLGANKAIKSITRSGTTFTYTCLDGTTGTFTQQDNNTTYSNFVKSGSGAQAGLVPAPSTTAGTTKYLREDGTWAVPPDTNTTYSVATTSANGLMTAAMVTKLNGIATGANAYTLPTASSSTLGGVKIGSNITVSSGVISLNSTNVTTALGYQPVKTVTLATDGTLRVNNNSDTSILSLSSYYLPLAGGTMTGQIRKAGSSSSWISGRNTAAVRINSYSAYCPGLSMKTTNGSWEIGVYTSDNLWFTYASDVNYDSNTNTVAQFHAASNGALYGAVWNDYAEFRSTVPNSKPGQVVVENGDGTLCLSSTRLQPGCEVVSDTFGFAIGETDDCKTPIAAAGRVLAYTYEDRNEFIAGEPVCSGPNGTVSRMTLEEARLYPHCIIGTVSEIPSYKRWSSGDVEVDGRIWIRIR